MVVFEYPEDRSQDYVKRVIALPGCSASPISCPDRISIDLFSAFACFEWLFPFEQSAVGTRSRTRSPANGCRPYVGCWRSHAGTS